MDGLEDFERRIRLTLDETRTESLALSQRGLHKEAIKVVNAGAKSLRAIKSEIMVAEREIRATATGVRQDIGGRGQLLGALLSSHARGVFARGRQAARRQLARNQTKVLDPYEHLRNEIQRNVAVLEHIKIELSRPTPSTKAQLASARTPVGADGNLTDDEFERPPTSQPSLAVASSRPSVSQPSGSVGRILKMAALAIGGLFVLVIVLAAATGSKKRVHTADSATTTGSAVDPKHAAANLKPLQEMLESLNSKLSAGWKKPPADAVARCRPACRNMNAIYKSKSDLCMKLCSSAENSSPIACMAKATTKTEANKCPSFNASPVKLVLGAQPNVVVLDTDLGCNLDLLKKLVGDDRGLGQAFAPYQIRQFACPDGKTAVNLTYDK